MEQKILAGKKIAVILESQYIPSEIAFYQSKFADLGADVHLMSRLWGQKKIQFVSEVEIENMIPDTIEVNIDFTEIDVNDYAAVIMAANYTSVRLRWLDDEKDLSNQQPNGDSGRQSPAVKFFYRVMMNSKIIKGFPCHGLWILSAIPEMLAGRKVICNKVMIGDVRNAGGIYTYSKNGVVVDADIVTSDGAAGDHDRTFSLIEEIKNQIIASDSGNLTPAITAFTTPSAFIKESVIQNPQKRKILMLVSEWGYWGEELVGPLEEFDKVGYETVFMTPKGNRPNAILVSKQADYIDPPLGRSVTSLEMAYKVEAFDDATTAHGRRLENPINLSSLFPERPYWADSQFVRMMEIYNQKLEISENEITQFDALIIVGGSGPIVDLVNNQKVHDLILAFYKAGKPIAAECYGVACLAFARNIEDRKSIIWGKRVTGHCLEYDYKDGTGFMAAKDTFLQFNMGPPPYPLEYILRDATGPNGAYLGNFGHPKSVIVDYPFITGRSTPDSYLTGKKLIEVLDGEPKLRKWGW